MRLTTLEIKGFKSFADKTVVHFNDNITGIVGPNGCGKSNIVDSIRWVLGEQKTSMLRLDKMNNLIFNGTKKRKASSLAEVSLTFENTKNVIATEYKTVTITRKLYRDGESEYRLNDVPCRLKDISNLFLDTGVSSDSYAIIELGMVDEILNDRENSRRRLFEQAAGISKYKTRKKETLNKLKGTEADLERVQDLLFEIENNLKSLESQAKRAQRYYKLKEDYKVLSLELAKHNLSAHKDTYKDLEKRKEQQSDIRQEIENKLKLTEAAIEKEKVANLEKEKALSTIQKQLNQLISAVGDKENERNLLSEQIKFLREKNETATRQLSDAKDQAERLKLSLESLKKDKDTESEALDAIQKETTELKEKLEAVRAEHQEIKIGLDADKATYANNEKKIYELEKQLAVNKASKDSLETELNESRQENMFKQEELKELEGQFKGVEKQKESESKKLESLQKEEEKIGDQLEKTEKELEEVKQDLNKQNRQLDSKQNEYNLTKSLVDNLEGFPESIKFLKKNAKWSEEAPLLTDIIYCDETYRVAIENFLEPYLNYYVVRNLDDAVMAVRLLNDSSKGRANFFILDDFKDHKPSKPLILENTKPATEIVELDKKYNQLAAYLLDKVYVIDDSNGITTEQLDKAINKLPEGTVLLTKSGKYIRSDYALSGGAVGLFEGKRIGRAKNLEKLEKEIKKLEQSTLKLNKKRDSLQQSYNHLKANSKREEISAQREVVSAINNEFTTVKTKIENFKAFIDSASEKVAAIKKRMADIDEQNVSINKELDELRKDQEQAKTRLEKIDSSFVDLTTRLNETSSSFNEKNIFFHQQQNKVNSLNQEFQYKQNQIEQLERQQQQNKQVESDTEDKIKETTSKLKELESSLLAGYDDREKIEGEVQEAEEAYYKSRSIITELENQQREISRNKEQADTLLSEIKEQLNDLKLELSSVKERLQIEFGVNINDIINEDPNEEHDPEQLEEKVTKLKNRLDNYGEINPMAVEAYEEMKERYDFIQSQKQDLEDAKETLLTTIQEIEDTAKEHFLDAFNKVRDSFIEVFQTLFSEGDECDLVLLDENDPLESKIEIMAKPKGKRPTVIDQLSGGEKTLTATALLFSLYLLKPAPFCIFDEVDAPLDDTNIGKFNKIIREFSKDSQFIIVTHNKQTMSHVDVIYGVTMAEQGISKVVPVDFRNLN